MLVSQSIATDGLTAGTVIEPGSNNDNNPLIHLLPQDWRTRFWKGQAWVKEEIGRDKVKQIEDERDKDKAGGHQSQP